MAIELTNLVWRLDIPGRDKSVLLSLADMAKKDNGYKCWPSLKTTARRTGWDEKTVKRSINRLIGLGYVLKANRSAKDGRSTSCEYWINLELLAAHVERQKCEINDQIETNLGGSESPPQGVTQTPPGGHAGGGEGVTQTPSYTLNLHLDTLDEPFVMSAGVPAAKPNRKSNFPDDFVLTKEQTDLATELGVDAWSELDHFKDWALANGKKFINWNAAFRNWLRNANKFKKNTGAQIHDNYAAMQRAVVNLKRKHPEWH